MAEAENSLICIDPNIQVFNCVLCIIETMMRVKLNNYGAPSVYQAVFTTLHILSELITTLKESHTTHFILILLIRGPKYKEIMVAIEIRSHTGWKN